MCSIKLRKYQEESVDRLNNLLDFVCPINCFCLTLPTGSGKSVIIAELVKCAIDKFEPTEMNILVCSWSVRIVKQDREKIEAIVPNALMWIERGTIDLCTVQSLRNYKQGKLYDIIIVDECHKMYVGTAGYREICSRMRDSNGDLRNKNSETKVFGFTATPYRNRKESILDEKMFLPVEEIVTYRRLIDDGYLVKPEYIKCGLFEYDVDKLDLNSLGDFSQESMEKQCEKALRAIASECLRVHDTGGQRVTKHCTLVFLPTVRICKEVKIYIEKEIKKIYGNSKCRTQTAPSVGVILGETDEDEREEILINYDIILNCGVLTTGVDITRVTTILMCRATKSNTLWKQIVGRGLRLHNGKSRCFVIDCGGNVERFGDDLDSQPSTSNIQRTGLPIMSECKKCHRYVHTNVKICPYCDNVLRTDEQIHALKLQKIYLEGGLLPVESYSEKTVRIPNKGIRHTVTVKFAYGRQRSFIFSDHPYSKEKYKEYMDVLKHSDSKKELLFLKVEEIKGFDTITDAKVIDI